MSEMVERVAKVLAGRSASVGDASWDELDERQRGSFMADARAAIGAMREPGQRPAFWTYDIEFEHKLGYHLYYFAPVDRAPPPYKTQRHVNAILDIADDGTLAGVELIDEMPPPPHAALQQKGSE